MSRIEQKRDSAVLCIINYSKCQATFQDALYTSRHEKKYFNFADIRKIIALYNRKRVRIHIWLYVISRANKIIAKLTETCHLAPILLKAI